MTIKGEFIAIVKASLEKEDLLQTIKLYKASDATLNSQWINIQAAFKSFKTFKNQTSYTDLVKAIDTAKNLLAKHYAKLCASLDSEVNQWPEKYAQIHTESKQDNISSADTKIIAERDQAKAQAAKASAELASAQAKWKDDEAQYKREIEELRKEKEKLSALLAQKQKQLDEKDELIKRDVEELRYNAETMKLKVKIEEIKKEQQGGLGDLRTVTGFSRQTGALPFDAQSFSKLSVKSFAVGKNSNTAEAESKNPDKLKLLAKCMPVTRHVLCAILFEVIQANKKNLNDENIEQFKAVLAFLIYYSYRDLKSGTKEPRLGKDNLVPQHWKRQSTRSTLEYIQRAHPALEKLISQILKSNVFLVLAFLQKAESGLSDTISQIFQTKAFPTLEDLQQSHSTLASRVSEILQSHQLSLDDLEVEYDPITNPHFSPYDHIVNIFQRGYLFLGQWGTKMLAILADSSIKEDPRARKPLVAQPQQTSVEAILGEKPPLHHHHRTLSCS